MKRFLILMVVFLVLGGVVFYFGWLQLRIPAGSYAVFFSRTGGWERETMRPGTFIWRWQQLVPGNASLYVFDVEPRRVNASVTGSLPSGPYYASLLDRPATFDYRIDVAVELVLDPELLPLIAEERNLRPDGVGELYDDALARVRVVAARVLHELFASVAIAETVHRTDAIEEVHGWLADRIPAALADPESGVELVHVAVVRVELPDLDLYGYVRELSREVVDARAHALAAAAVEVAREQTQSDRQFELLERYGQLLERYPVLLDYFRASRELGGDPLNIEQLVPDRAP